MPKTLKRNPDFEAFSLRLVATNAQIDPTEIPDSHIVVQKIDATHIKAFLIGNGQIKQDFLINVLEDADIHTLFPPENRPDHRIIQRAGDHVDLVDQIISHCGITPCEPSKNIYVEQMKDANFKLPSNDVEKEVKLYADLCRGISVNGENLQKLHDRNRIQGWVQPYNGNILACHRQIDELLRDELKNNQELVAKIKQFVRDNPDFDLLGNIQGAEIRHPWSLQDLVERVEVGQVVPDQKQLSVVDFENDVGRVMAIAIQHVTAEDIAALTEEQKGQYEKGIPITILYKNAYGHKLDMTSLDCKANLDTLIMNRLGINKDQLNHFKVQHNQNVFHFCKTPVNMFFLNNMDHLRTLGVAGNLAIVEGDRLSYLSVDEKKVLNLNTHAPIIALNDNLDIYYKFNGAVTTHSRLEPDAFTQGDLIVEGEEGYEEFLEHAYRENLEEAFQAKPLERVSFLEALELRDLGEGLKYQHKIAVLQNQACPPHSIDEKNSSFLVDFLDETYRLYGEDYTVLYTTTKSNDKGEKKLAFFKDKSDIEIPNNKHFYALVKSAQGWQIFYYKSRQEQKISLEDFPGLKDLLQNIETPEALQAQKLQIDHILSMYHSDKHPELAQDKNEYLEKKDELIKVLENAPLFRAELFNTISQENDDFSIKLEQNVPASDQAFFKFKQENQGLFFPLKNINEINTAMITGLTAELDTLNDGSHATKRATLSEGLTHLWDLQILLANCENPQTYRNVEDIGAKLNAQLTAYNHHFKKIIPVLERYKDATYDSSVLIQANILAQLEIISQLKNTQMTQKRANIQQIDISEKNEPELSFIQSLWIRINILHEHCLLKLAEFKDNAKQQINLQHQLHFLYNIESILFDIFQAVKEADTEEKGKNILNSQLVNFRDELWDFKKVIPETSSLYGEVSKLLNSLLVNSVESKKNEADDKQTSLGFELNQELEHWYDQDQEAKQLRALFNTTHAEIIQTILEQQRAWQEINSDSYGLESWLSVYSNLNEHLVELYAAKNQLLNFLDRSQLSSTNLEGFKQQFIALVDDYFSTLKKIKIKLRASAENVEDILKKYQASDEYIRLSIEERTAAPKQQQLSALKQAYENCANKIENECTPAILSYTNPFWFNTWELSKKVERINAQNHEQLLKNNSPLKSFYFKEEDGKLVDTPRMDFVKFLRAETNNLSEIIRKAINSDILHEEKTLYTNFFNQFLKIAEENESVFLRSDQIKLNPPHTFNKEFLRLLSEYKSKLETLSQSLEFENKKLSQPLQGVVVGQFPIILERVNEEREQVKLAILEDLETEVVSLQIANQDKKEHTFDKPKPAEIEIVEEAVGEQNLASKKMNLITFFHQYKHAVNATEALWNSCNRLVEILNTQLSENAENVNAKLAINEQLKEVLSVQKKLLDFYSPRNGYQLKNDDLNAEHDREAWLFGFDDLLKVSLGQLNNLREKLDYHKTQYKFDDQNLGPCNKLIENTLQQYSFRGQELLENNLIVISAINKVLTLTVRGDDIIGLQKKLRTDISNFKTQKSTIADFMDNLLQLKRKLENRSGGRSPLWWLNPFNWPNFREIWSARQLHDHVVNLFNRFGVAAATSAPTSEGYVTQLGEEIAWKQQQAQLKANPSLHYLNDVVEKEYRSLFQQVKRHRRDDSVGMQLINRVKAETLAKDRKEIIEIIENEPSRAPERALSDVRPVPGSGK